MTNPRVWNPRIVEQMEARTIKMRRVVLVLVGNLSFNLLVEIMSSPETIIVIAVRYPTTF